MKKITLFLFLLIASFGHAQQVLEDFEGTAPTLANFDGFGSSVVTANPTNASEKSLELITSATAAGWQGSQFVFQGKTLDLSQADKTITINVHSTVATSILAKAAGGENAGADSAADANHTGSGWELLTFDFSSPKDNTAVGSDSYTSLVFFPAWNNLGGTCINGCYSGSTGDSSPVITIYIDDVTGLAPKEVLEDFEGTAPTLANFDGFGSSVVTANPTNASEKSLELITSATAAGWQGSQFVFQGKTLDLSQADKTITINVHSTVATSILAKAAGGENAGADSAADANHTGSGWELLTFDFSSPKDNTAVGSDSYTSLVFFPAWNNLGGTCINGCYSGSTGDSSPVITIYIDDVTGFGVGASETCSDGIMNQDETGIDCGGTCDACPSPPTTAPTAPPTRNAGDVISLYSEAYTNVASNFDAGWCNPNSIEEVSIAGNNVQAYKGNACQGIVLDAGIDASAFTNLHVDVYIEAGVDVTSKVFNLKFVQQPGGGALEVNFNAASSPALVAGSWIAIDVVVDLSTFTGFKEFGITAGNLANQVWYDNLYVYKAATAGVSDNAALDVSMHPNPAAGVLNLSAANTIEDAIIYNVLGREVMGLNIDSNSAAIDVSGLSSGIYLIKYTIGDAVGTAKFIKE